jgi:hypothetical protein
LTVARLLVADAAAVETDEPGQETDVPGEVDDILGLLFEALQDRVRSFPVYLFFLPQALCQTGYRRAVVSCERDSKDCRTIT